jgi:hypothetical protein
MVQQISPCCTGTGSWTCIPPAYVLPQRLEDRRAAERSRTGTLRRSNSEDRTPFVGCLHPRRAHHTHGATPSDLHVQVVPDNLLSPLEHCIDSSPVACPSLLQTHVRVATRNNLDPFSYASTRLSSLRELSHLVLISPFSFVPDFYFTQKQPLINFVAPFYFTIRRISVDATAPEIAAPKYLRRNVTV